MNPLDQPLDLKKIIKSPEEISDIPDSKSSKEVEKYELEYRSAIVEGTRQDNAERKKYASRIYWAVISWVILTGLAVMLRGLTGSHIWNWTISFQLSDNVLIAMVGGTAASLIGLLLTVARYLFRPSG